MRHREPDTQPGSAASTGRSGSMAGDNRSPSSGVSWKPMSSSSVR
jgi:hypothetical protein